MMQRRMFKMQENLDMMKVCFIEAQLYPELRDRIQLEVVDKMTDIAKGVYRKSLSPKVIAKVFVGMFDVAGFSSETLSMGESPMELKAMAEGLSDLFLNGVLAKA